jgi:hypothetical protein
MREDGRDVVGQCTSAHESLKQVRRVEQSIKEEEIDSKAHTRHTNIFQTWVKESTLFTSHYIAQARILHACTHFKKQKMNKRHYHAQEHANNV